MKLRALIVDDEYPARKELRYMLEKFDYIEVVGEATNAKEALALISALDYAIIFLDIEMPGMNGIELCQTLQNQPDPPFIILVTAYESYALKAFEVNAVDLSSNPLTKNACSKLWQKFSSSCKANKASNLMRKPVLKNLTEYPLKSRVKRCSLMKKRFFMLIPIRKTFLSRQT